MVKISELSNGAGIGGTEQVPVNDSGTTVKYTVDQILARQHDHNVTDIQATTGNVIVARNSATAGDMAEVAIGASKLVGRGSTGNITEISLGASIEMSTTTLQRAALTGAITASANSNTTALGSFTLAQLNTAVSDANIIPEGGGTFTGDISVPDESYGSGWNASVEVPTKNAIYDKIETITNGQRTKITKTTTTQRTSTTIMASDPELTFSMSANTKYTIRGFVMFEANSAPDIKLGWTAPSSPTLAKISRSHFAPTTPTSQTSATDDINTVTTITCSTGVYGFLYFTGVVHNGANAGSFAIQWAQNLSDANVTQVLAGSYIEYISY